MENNPYPVRVANYVSDAETLAYEILGPGKFTLADLPTLEQHFAALTARAEIFAAKEELPLLPYEDYKVRMVSCVTVEIKCRESFDFGVDRSGIRGALARIVDRIAYRWISLEGISEVKARLLRGEKLKLALEICRHKTDFTLETNQRASSLG